MQQFECRPIVISKEEAKAKGLKRFYTSIPCNHGHLAERFVTSNGCVVCQAARFTNWYARSPRRVAKVKRESFRQEAAEKGLETFLTGQPCKNGHISERSTSTGQCIECRKVRALRWFRSHPEQVKQYLSETIEVRRERQRIWRLRNPDTTKKLRRAHEASRRARQRKSGGSFTRQQIDELMVRQNRKCACCRVSLRGGYEIDHVMPIALGGDSSITNIQLLCPGCNRKKSDKHPLAWAREFGRLL